MHKCLKCGKAYAREEDVPIITGCSCGSKFFVFIRDDDQEKTEKLLDRVTLEELEVIEKKIVAKNESEETPRPAEKAQKPASGKPRPKSESFGIETVKTIKPGVYELNIEALLSGAPVIVLQKGETYIIHLSSVFKSKKD